MHFSHSLWLHWWFWDYRKVLPAIIPTILVLFSIITLVFSLGWHAWLLPVMCYCLQTLLYCLHRDTITLGLDLFSCYCFNGTQWERVTQSKGSTRLDDSLSENRDRGSSPKHHASLKNLMIDKVPKNKAASVNFSLVKFSLLDFLTLEDGSDMLSQNIIKILAFYAV